MTFLTSEKVATSLIYCKCPHLNYFVHVLECFENIGKAVVVALCIVVCTKGSERECGCSDKGFVNLIELT